MVNVWGPDHDPPEGSMAARFKEERVAKGYTQKSIAQELGMGLQQIQHIEGLFGDPVKKFKIFHWGRMAHLRMDVPYILVGTRTQQLTSEEQALLDNYRHLGDEQKESIEKVSEAMASLTQEKAANGTD